MLISTGTLIKLAIGAKQVFKKSVTNRCSKNVVITRWRAKGEKRKTNVQFIKTPVTKAEKWNTSF